MSVLLTGILLAAVVLPWAQGQFPKACVNFESLRDKRCCPIPKGFNLPCGRDANRGECHELNVRQWSKRYSHYQDFHEFDDRRDWPTGLYSFTCKCNPPFGGYDCGKCEYGYYGNDCKEKRIQRRRNFAGMSEREKDRYTRYINLTRYADSGYVVTKASYNKIQNELKRGRDPTGLFLNITNYDYFVWLHYYAARDTIFPDNHTVAEIDFAHEGQGFPSWHRLYMLQWERTIQELANDTTFTVPYWDWTENQHKCEICTEDFLGVTAEDGTVKGKYFNDWHIICTASQTAGLTKMCDPEVRKRGLERMTDEERENRTIKGDTMTFPTKKEVNFALRFEAFDVPPYNKETSCNFRNTLEGFVNTTTGYRMPKAHTLHNNVHIVLGGTMGDVPSASNDPIFPLHHSFVDRIFEKWLRRYSKSASVLSQYDAPIGHNRYGVIVPLFPVYTHDEMFKKSFEFGYEYEDVDSVGKSSDDEKQENQEETGYLGMCPVPCKTATKSSGSVAVPIMYTFIWCLAMFTIIG